MKVRLMSNHIGENCAVMEKGTEMDWPGIPTMEMMPLDSEAKKACDEVWQKAQGRDCPYGLTQMEDSRGEWPKPEPVRSVPREKSPG